MTITETITNHIQNLPLGQPLTPKSLLHLGSRAAIDQVLSRLAREGMIRRVVRGVYARPIVQAWGESLPGATLVAQTICEANGAILAPHGAAAVNHFGLSTQVPMKPIFLTSGQSKTFKLGKLEVQLKHVSQNKLLAANTEAGLAITALRYLGKTGVSPALVRQITKQLPEVELERLRGVAMKLPGWLIQVLYEAEVLRA